LAPAEPAFPGEPAAPGPAPGWPAVTVSPLKVFPESVTGVLAL
jgi:hypothetical protein